MEKKTFICETVKSVLVELAKADPRIFAHEKPVHGCQALDGIIDTLAKSLCSAYDNHLK